VVVNNVIAIDPGHPDLSAFAEGGASQMISIQNNILSGYGSAYVDSEGDDGFDCPATCAAGVISNNVLNASLDDLFADPNGVTPEDLQPPPDSPFKGMGKDTGSYDCGPD